MKNKIAWLLPMACAMLLGSCGNPQAETSSIVTSSQTSEEESLPELSDVDYDLSVSLEGSLNDFMVGVAALDGHEYILRFGFSKANVNNAKVSTDRPNVASVEKRAETWYFVAKKPSKTHLVIQDEDDVIHCRCVVQVKPELSVEEIEEAIVEVDHWSVRNDWKPLLGNWDCTFFPGNRAQMSGTEIGGTVLTGVTFTYEYDEEIGKGSAYDDGSWYGFRVKNWTVSDFILEAFFVYKSGDLMQMNTTNMLLGILVPEEAK